MGFALRLIFWRRSTFMKSAVNKGFDHQGGQIAKKKVTMIGGNRQELHESHLTYPSQNA